MINTDVLGTQYFRKSICEPPLVPLRHQDVIIRGVALSDGRFILSVGDLRSRQHSITRHV